MRTDLENSQLFEVVAKSLRVDGARKALDGNVTITDSGPLASFFDANGSNRNVTLPPIVEGRVFIISNVGAANNLVVKNSGGTTITTLLPADTAVIVASDAEWCVLRGWAALGVFTNTINGLVPAPNSAVPGSLFLRDDGQWGQIQVVGIVDAFKYISDGTNIAVGSGPDTFRLRSSTGSVSITVTNNEAVFGDNANFDVVEAAVDHDALLNFVANEHIDHTAVTLTAGLGLSGGGDISSSRSFAFDPSELTDGAIALTDYVVTMLVAGTPRRTLLSSINGVLNHNALLNYVADQHVAHSSVSITGAANGGLSGGGTIAASRTLALDFTNLPTDDTITAADLIAFYDTSETDHGSNTFAQFNGALDHNSLANYVANEHINHTSVSISAGTGLTGGGTIAASRTISLDTIANLRVFANISGGAAVPSANTLTAILDAIIGSTRGMLLKRGAASWESLGIGANNTYLKSDGTDPSWASIAAGGDVVGPASATDNAAARFDTTTGKLIQNSAMIIDDTTGRISRSGNGGIQQQGTNTNDNAAAGDVGEFVSSSVLVASSVSLTSGVTANITSISLTAGDWDVSAVVTHNTANVGGATSRMQAGVNTVSATLPTAGASNGIVIISVVPVAGDPYGIPIPPTRFSLSATTTVYLVANQTFSSGTASAYGFISARRVR